MVYGVLGEQVCVCVCWGVSPSLIYFFESGINCLTLTCIQLGGGRPNTTGNGTVPPHPSPSGIACTSIVAQDASGNVYHGRNLDWNIPDDLKNLSVQVTQLAMGAAY